MKLVHNCNTSLAVTVTNAQQVFGLDLRFARRTSWRPSVQRYVGQVWRTCGRVVADPCLVVVLNCNHSMQQKVNNAARGQGRVVTASANRTLFSLGAL